MIGVIVVVPPPGGFDRGNMFIRALSPPNVLLELKVYVPGASGMGL